MQQPTRLGFRFGLGFGQRTADSGLWLVAPTRTPPQEEWKMGRVAGKVLNEEKSSKVKSSQVGSRNLFHLSWFLERFTHSQKHKTSAIASATNRSFEAFPSPFPPTPFLHLLTHPTPLPLLGKLGAHKKLPVSRWSASRGGQLERGTLNLFGSCYICGINIVSDRYRTSWIDRYIDRVAISDTATARRQSFNRSFVLFAASSAADAYQNSMQFYWLIDGTHTLYTHIDSHTHV